MKGNKFVRIVYGFPEPWCDHCRVFTDKPSDHTHPEASRESHRIDRFFEKVR